MNYENLSNDIRLLLIPYLLSNIIIFNDTFLNIIINT